MDKGIINRLIDVYIADSEDCKQCPKVLTEIENIDDEADKAGIKFVKIDDKNMAKEVGVFALPAIVFYKTGSKEPVIYAGDIYEEQDILSWLITQKDPGGDVIEDLEGEKLKLMIEEHESIAVFFCKLQITTSNMINGIGYIIQFQHDYCT